MGNDRQSGNILTLYELNACRWNSNCQTSNKLTLYELTACSWNLKTKATTALLLSVYRNLYLRACQREVTRLHQRNWYTALCKSYYYIKTNNNTNNRIISLFLVTSILTHWPSLSSSLFLLPLNNNNSNKKGLEQLTISFSSFFLSTLLVSGVASPSPSLSRFAFSSEQRPLVTTSEQRAA